MIASGQSLSSLQEGGRSSVLEGLNKFIEDSEDKLEEILRGLGWTRDSLKAAEMVQCPIDPRHMMPASSLPKHMERCQWAQEGYSREEYVETPSSSFFYQNTDTVFSLKIDQDLQNQILTSVNGAPTSKPVPRTPGRARSDLTQPEKLALYEHVVAEGQRSRRTSLSTKLLSELGEDPDVPGGSKNALVKSESKSLSRLEVLKQMRDYKRRRQSYRAKNVHITRRSQTDIMREIIANQMEELEADRALAGPSSREGSTSRRSSPKRNRTSRANGQAEPDGTSHPVESHQGRDIAERRSRVAGEVERSAESQDGFDRRNISGERVRCDRELPGEIVGGSRDKRQPHEGRVGNEEGEIESSISRENSVERDGRERSRRYSHESSESRGEDSGTEGGRQRRGRSRGRSRSSSKVRSHRRHKHSKKHKKHKKGHH